MGFTTNKANSILNNEFAKTYYIALSTTTPNDNGGNVTEPSSSSGYKRCQMLAMGSASYKQIQNTDIMYFGEAVADWGTITHFAVYTSSTGGTPHYYGALASPVTVTTGQVGLIRASNFKVGLDKITLD